MKEDRVKIVGNYSPSGHSSHSVVDANGIAPIVMENHGQVTAVVENLKEELCNNLIENGLVKENDVIRHNYTTNKKGDCIQSNNESPTLDTRCDCLGVVVKDEPRVIGGIGEKKSNSGTQWYQQDRIYADGIAISTTTTAQPYYKTGLRIRKLTPRECMRLMGVKDEDSNKIQQGDSSMYHLAGDSIVTSCLMGLFGELLDIDYKQKINELVEEIANEDKTI